MSSKKIRWLILVSFLAIFASGCHCSDNQIDIMQVFNDSPGVGELVSSLLPTFSWHNSEGCDPDRYSIHIREYASHGGSYLLSTPDENTTHTMTGSPLEPGHEYIFQVSAVEDGYGWSDYSSKTIFYTGPVCSGEPLEAPFLVVPMEDGWMTTPDPIEFRWNNTGDCLPDHYNYQFATDPGFSNLVAAGPTYEQYAQHVELSFPNCSTLFWRVAANDGTMIGPWSDTRQFHYVMEGTSCYQTQFISDDAARIDVQLYWDDCSQTGYNSTAVMISDPGCKADDISTIIIADGERTFPPSDYGMGGFVADLGSGPCPSMGLDQKTRSELPFHVLAPGTYCVSITRDQTLDSYPNAYLMDGIWSEPRTNDVIAYQTVEVGPGTSEIVVEFGWDEYDLEFLMPEFDFTMECRFCPDPIGPVAGFLMAGQPVPIYGRDWQSDWKLTEVSGKLCYAQLSDFLVDEALANYEGLGLRSADLEQFPPAPPCPEDDKPVRDSGPKTCSDYQTPESCKIAGCAWRTYCTDN